MKNQYFGDINDYLKYSLLRSCSRTLALAVCWMLTAPDGRSDGSAIDYLAQPSAFRAIDPQLFDALAAAVANGRRDVDVMGDAALFSNAVFYDVLLTDLEEARATYFQTLRRTAETADL